MEIQEPDPIREYLINEMLKNLIYIGLVRDKDNIEKKLRQELTIKKRNKYLKELKLLTEDISILKTNKNAKYNEILYKRFYGNLTKIKKIINENKKNFEDLINTYLALIDSNQVSKNPALLTKQLEYIRNKLRTYISVIPTDTSENEKQNFDSYKQSLLELEKKLNLLSTQTSAISNEEFDLYNLELERINDNIKSSTDEDLKSFVSKLKVKIAEIKNKSNSDIKSNYSSYESDSDSDFDSNSESSENL